MGTVNFDLRKRLRWPAACLLVMVTALLLMPQNLKIQVQKHSNEAAAFTINLLKQPFNDAASTLSQPISKGDEKIAPSLASNSLLTKITVPESVERLILKGKRWLNTDRREHAAIFFICSLVLLIWLSPLATLSTLTLYAAATETLQHFSPGRTPDPADFFANLVGVGLAILCFIVYRSIHRKLFRISSKTPLK